MLEELPKLLSDVLATFGDARTESFRGNPWRRWVQEASQEALSSFARAQGLYVKVGSGDGGWPEIPWIGLGSKQLAETSQRGVYVAFLFNRNLEGCTLSIQQGVGDMKDAIGMRRSRPILLSRAAMIRGRKPPPERFALQVLDLGASDRRGRLYQVAHVCGRAYSQADLGPGVSADLIEIVAYYLSLASDSQILGTVNSVPSLVESYPDLLHDSEELNSDDYNRKYASLIEEIAEQAKAEEDDLLGGTPKSAALVARRLGQEALRKALLDLYEPVCAACGDAIVVSSPNTRERRFSLHAAHIVSVESGGRTRVYNGLLLCPNHHWGFDNYCWWIEKDGRLTVRDGLRESAFMGSLHGRQLPQPSAAWAKPSLNALAHHRRKARAAARHSRAL